MYDQGLIDPKGGEGCDILTAIQDSVLSKIQIRQWLVTNYSNSYTIWTAIALLIDNVDFTS